MGETTYPSGSISERIIDSTRAPAAVFTALALAYVVLMLAGAPALLQGAVLAIALIIIAPALAMGWIVFRTDGLLAHERRSPRLPAAAVYSYPPADIFISRPTHTPTPPPRAILAA